VRGVFFHSPAYEMNLTSMVVGGGREPGAPASIAAASRWSPRQPACEDQDNLHATVKLSGEDPKISAPIPFFATCCNQSSSMKFSNGGTSVYSFTTSCSGISRLA
jgi:hypothetical protein